MLSARLLTSSSKALDYYAPDNYYTEHEGFETSEWFGLGAAALQLEGHVEKESLRDVLNGNIAGQELGRWITDEEAGERVKDHRPGIDFTFSAPKSFSILSGVFEF